MKNVAELFERFLRQRDLRLTRQRLEILKTIYATHRHVSADELYEMLQSSKQARALRISRATVYRTLALLEEGGFVEKMTIRDRGTLYEHVLGHEHHDHMVCLDCGRILEFHDDELERVQEDVVTRHGFEATSHRLNVYGYCASCRPKRRAAGQTADGGQAGADG